MTGCIRAIWVKRFKGGPMDPRDVAILVPGAGLLGNANKGGRRQVVLIEEEAWNDALADLGAALDPATRRANLLLTGIRLKDTRGRILRIGPARLRIWSECTPCHQMDEARPGLKEALRPHWRAGVCAEVLDGGEVRVGDQATWEEETKDPVDFSPPSS